MLRVERKMYSKIESTKRCKLGPAVYLLVVAVSLMPVVAVTMSVAVFIKVHFVDCRSN